LRDTGSESEEHFWRSGHVKEFYAWRKASAQISLIFIIIVTIIIVTVTITTTLETQNNLRSY